MENRQSSGTLIHRTVTETRRTECELRVSGFSLRLRLSTVSLYAE